MTKSIQDYENNIAGLHNGLIDYPESTTLQNKLSRKLTSWSKKLNILIHRASNEQTGWTTEEVGFNIIPMGTKNKTGFKQTGDYIAYLDDYDMFCGLCVERKGVTRANGRVVGMDLYSTFANKDNRRRFNAEIERFEVDNRFDTMVLISECSRGEFLTFKPMFNGKNYNKTNKTNYGMSIESRRATIAKLEIQGIHVDFAGTRREAIEHYKALITQWCRAHYKQMLKLK